MSGRRTLNVELFREGTPLRPRSVLSDAKVDIVQKRKKIQPFVFSSWWDGKSQPSLEFVGVSGFFFFISFSKLEMDADAREAAPGRETESTKKLVCQRA